MLQINYCIYQHHKITTKNTTDLLQGIFCCTEIQIFDKKRTSSFDIIVIIIIRSIFVITRLQRTGITKILQSDTLAKSLTCYSVM